MDLEDIIPAKPQFTLQSTGKTYTLRIVNLEDHVWLKDKFGGAEEVKKVLQENDWSKAILLIYRLLIDKKDFMSQKETVVDDDGVESEVMATGPYRLLRAISGVEEGVKVMGALAKSIMLSNPTIDKAVKETVKEELKKNKIQTGQKSSTSSRASTAGQPSK